MQIVVGSVGGPRYGIDYDLEAASMLGVTIQKQVFGHAMPHHLELGKP